MSMRSDFDLHREVHLKALADLECGVPSGLVVQLNELAPVVGGYEMAAATIQADARLSDVGRQHAAKVERDKAAAAIGVWKAGKIGGVDAQVAALESARQAQANQRDGQPTEFQVKFMAEKLVALDPLECEILYSDGSEEERLTIEAAVEAVGRVPRRRGPDGALVWEHLLDPARIASARAARLERADPNVAASLRDLARIRNVYAAMASAATSLVGASQVAVEP